MFLVLFYVWTGQLLKVQWACNKQRLNDSPEITKMDYVALRVCVHTRSSPSYAHILISLM